MPQHSFADEWLSQYGHDAYIVVPEYATGTSWDGTRRYHWKAAFAPIYRHSAVAGAYPATPEGWEVAWEHADRLTAAGEPF
jgi:hypothetical protein